MTEQTATYTAFVGHSRIATGPLQEVLPHLKTRHDRGDNTIVQVFDDQTGKHVDFDLRGSLDDVIARATPARAQAGPGRPKLGVVSREVSLLPRHWEWLERQPNGASAALRRMVSQAINTDPDKQRAREVVAAAYRIMTAMAGDLPGYEEATRALSAADRKQFRQCIKEWPHDIRAYLQRQVEHVLR